MTNWIAAHNPHNLPAPPEWWLTALADLHPRIVLFPGVTEKVYRVGERVDAARWLKTADPDSEAGVMLAAGCVPLVSLVPWVTWNQDFFEWLDAHDKWALKGKAEGAGEAAADRLDELDRQREAKQDAEQSDQADQVGASAYFGLLSRRGNMVIQSGDHRKS